MGHLLFIPALGDSRSQLNPPNLVEFVDNDNWVDNVCDGWVSVEITHQLDANPQPGIVDW